MSGRLLAALFVLASLSSSMAAQIGGLDSQSQQNQQGQQNQQNGSRQTPLPWVIEPPKVNITNRPCDQTSTVPAGQPGLEARQLPVAPEPDIEFQRFVASTLGYNLPIFGQNLFENVPSTFAPLDYVPVT